ncbi:MAG: exodeoxyribonuclease VII large subunit [Gammaproteobacteria bacterium]|nr:exodeoxyribonuclease VII large subunit [Gammaproteobacteria bacterium]
MNDEISNEAELILSVSELSREARYLLEENFPAVMVEGEISNIAMPASGHWYLTLKDESAQIRCAMFRNRNMRVRFKPEDGMQVLVKGKVSLYEGRGDFQLIVERMEERGDGALLRAFEQLKEKLHQEGLFDDALKKELPALPRHIGVITSPTGAAVRDIISTLRRRFPAIAVTVMPVTVQGDSAADEIIHAIEVANRKNGCLSNLDLLIIGRGGGSLEDLWSFNNEALARCIFASDLPIVSAVGHEVDFTIADFVADLRAATPTAAAEIISPDQEEYRLLFSAYTRQFAAIIEEMISQKQQSVLWLKKRLKHPGRKLQEHAQALDEKEARLQRAFNNRLHMIKGQLKQLHLGIRAHTPQRMIRVYQQEYKNKGHRLLKAIRQDLQNKKLQLAEHSHALNTVSPLSTLGRGYSITYSDTHQVITDYQSVKAGDTIRSRLLNGEIISKVDTSIKLKDTSQKQGKVEKSS